MNTITNATIQSEQPLPAQTTESEQAWQRQYEALIAYRRHHPNNWPKVREDFPEGNRLGLWCTYQRLRRNEGQLSQERQRLLGRIHFPWDGHYTWRKQFVTLVGYRVHHPDKWPSHLEEWPVGNRIGAWCHTQRTSRRRRKLGPERMDMLNTIGFPWYSSLETRGSKDITPRVARQRLHRERNTASRGWLGGIIGMANVVRRACSKWLRRKPDNPAEREVLRECR